MAQDKNDYVILLPDFNHVSYIWDFSDALNSSEHLNGA